MKQILATGKILSSHGVKGYVKVRPYSDDSSHLFKLKTVLITLKTGKNLELEVEDVKPFSDGILMKFKGYDNPEDIRIFSGCDILVHREQAGKLDKGKVYIADLQGMKLLYDKEEVGTVVSTVEGAQALLLEVLCKDGKKRLVPFMRKVFIDEVDVENATMKLLKRELVI